MLMWADRSNQSLAESGGQLPSATRIAEVITKFQEAASCRSCRRGPSSRAASTGDGAERDGGGQSNDGAGGGSSPGCYEGALLVSPSCGDFFCKDCWDHARGKSVAEASTQSESDRRGVQCPVCRRHIHLDPRPIMSSLMSASVHHVPAALQYEPEHCLGATDLTSSAPIACMNEKPETVKQLVRLLGMLRQFTGVVFPDTARVEGNCDTGRKGGEQIAKDKSPEEGGSCVDETGGGELSEDDIGHETEVPETFVPFMGSKADRCDSSCSDLCTNHHDAHQGTREAVQEKMSPQCSAQGVPGVVAETPTVHESQISSIRLSSIKSGGTKRECEHDLDEDAPGETEVPGTYLSPLRKRHLKMYNPDSFAKRNKPSQVGDFAEERDATRRKSDQMETVFSPINQSETQVSGTLLPCCFDTREPRSQRGATDHLTETEVPGTCLPPLCNHNSELLDSNAFTQPSIRGKLRELEDDDDGSEVSECQSQLITGQDLERDNSNHNRLQMEGRIEPVLNQSETQVPGTLLPSISNEQAPMEGDATDKVERSEQLNRIDDIPVGGLRRVSASPNKVQITKEASNQSPSKTRPLLEEPASSQMNVARDIHHWNLQSEPIMSPLTCDVKTCRLTDATQTATLKDLTVAGSRNINSPQKLMGHSTKTSSDRNRKLYVAYDMLDLVELSALRALHDQDICRVVMDGVHCLRKDHERFPFPAILVAHAVDKPSLGRQELGQTTIATCHRTYSYLHAKALGARIVDARWILDSQNAGFLLDYKTYEVWGDVESYELVTAEGKLGNDATVGMPMPLRESITILHGLSFSLLRDCSSSSQREFRELTESQSAGSSLCLETKPMSTQEIESLVVAWGGKVITDALTHVDILLVDDHMALHQIVEGLKDTVSRIDRWSLEKWTNSSELDEILSRDRVEDVHVRIPIVRTKWLEDSIALHSLQSLTRYCWGIISL